RLSLDMAAVMAAQLLITLMYGHARIATRTFRQPAAVVAEQSRSETAAVEEHQYLLAGCQGLGDGLLHRPGDAGIQWPALHVQAQEARLAGAAGTLGLPEQGVAASMGVMQAYQRRCGYAALERPDILAHATQHRLP